MKNRITTAVAVYIILDKGHGRILLARRCGTGYQDGMWQVPAGHVETGELPTEAAVREAKEEVGVIISKRDMHLIHVSARPKHDETGNRIDLFFRVHRWRGEPEIKERNKCDMIYWGRFSELPSNTTPHVRTGIVEGYKGRIFSEFTLSRMHQLPEYGLV